MNNIWWLLCQLNKKILTTQVASCNLPNFGRMKGLGGKGNYFFKLNVKYKFQYKFQYFQYYNSNL